ncbi:hypothetical protein [Streptomyces sp. NPDC057582]|uniref:hypothetical protein n=1 Tax=Streptomyces sp. NPDC057582 TaxID=3346174 RepID=UPI0036BF4B6B
MKKRLRPVCRRSGRYAEGVARSDAREKGENLDRLAAEGVVGSINLGSWATRQLTRWKTLEDGQRQLVAALDLTPAPSTLTPRPATRRAFAETVQFLELFLHRERRAPAARKASTVDGDTVKIGPWFAKMRTKHRAGQLDPEHERLVAALFEGDWTAKDPAPAFA